MYPHKVSRAKVALYFLPIFPMLRFLPLDAKHVTENYPYGFTARTTLTQWVEHKKGKGFRSASQTVNQKTGKPNAPKYSTYYPFVRLAVDAETDRVSAHHFSPYEYAAYVKAVSSGLFDGIDSATYPHELVARSMLRQSISWHLNFSGFTSTTHAYTENGFEQVGETDTSGTFTPPTLDPDTLAEVRDPDTTLERLNEIATTLKEKADAIRNANK